VVVKKDNGSFPGHRAQVVVKGIFQGMVPYCTQGGRKEGNGSPEIIQEKKSALEQKAEDQPEIEIDPRYISSNSLNPMFARWMDYPPVYSPTPGKRRKRTQDKILQRLSRF
jgi:hypothetical protein